MVTFGVNLEQWPKCHIVHSQFLNDANVSTLHFSVSYVILTHFYKACFRKFTQKKYLIAQQFKIEDFISHSIFDTE